MNPWIVALGGWLVASLVMVGVWWWQTRTNKAGIVDVVWSYLVGALGVSFAVLGSGLPERRWIIAGLATVWSVRLGTYLWLRVRSHKEDGRYLALKEQWGEKAQFKMALFFQYQAFGAALFALPMLVAAGNKEPLGWIDGVAVGLFVLAATGEALADRQLAQFKADGANVGKVCDKGLWKYSRHPNYFFEWLHWWAYVGLAWAAPWGGLALIGPAAMFYFIVYVTGIPPAEKRALESRGDAYRDYQRRTSPFFPLPPRSSSPSKAEGV